MSARALRMSARRFRITARALRMTVSVLQISGDTLRIKGGVLQVNAGAFRMTAEVTGTSAGAFQTTVSLSQIPVRTIRIIAGVFRTRAGLLQAGEGALQAIARARRASGSSVSLWGSLPRTLEFLFCSDTKKESKKVESVVEAVRVLLRKNRLTPETSFMRTIDCLIIYRTTMIYYTEQVLKKFMSGSQNKPLNFSRD